MTSEHSSILIDPEVVGKRAECYGATSEMLAVPGPPSEVRFEGTLTGEYRIDPRWNARKWYKMVDLTDVPPDWDDGELWCDWGEVWLLE